MGKDKIIVYIIIVIMICGCYNKRYQQMQPVNISGEYVYRKNTSSLIISLKLFENGTFIYYATQGMYFEYSEGNFIISKGSYIKLNAVYPYDTSIQLKRFNWKEFHNEEMFFDNKFNLIRYNNYNLNKISTN